MTDHAYSNHKLLAFPAERDSLGRFQKGGAPGRPKGAVGRKSRASLEQIKSFGPQAIAKLWEAVNAGERWAIELVISKIIPTNSRAIEWEGVDIEDAKEALKSGDISISEFRELVSSLAKLVELSELEEIKTKLDALEKIANAK